jgi:alpha-L-rhamnosidase
MGEPKRDIFILRGDPSGETFEPRFTYRGFRYVQVLGAAVELTLESIEGIAIQSDLAVTGQLRIEDPLLQAIWEMVLRTQRSNVIGIPTDCPSREQRGWLADAAISWDAAAFSLDICAFTAHYMNHVMDGQLSDGAFPELAPWPRKWARFGEKNTAPAWGDGGIILPWIAWWRYGDLSIIERTFDAMCRHVQSIYNKNPDYLWRNGRGADYGDWLAPDQLTFDPSTQGATPKDLIATAYWAHSVDLLARMAQAIGRSDDYARLRHSFDRICTAFNAAYVSSKGEVGTGSQTCYVLALKFGLLPDRLRVPAAEHLASDVRERGVALTTGFLGSQFILDVLADSGYEDLACGLLLRVEYPSWGYMLRNDATTLWEGWSGEIKWEGKVCKISQNHVGLSAVGGFLFRRVAGIDAGEPGFERIIIHPAVNTRIKRAGGDYESAIGRISTDWEQKANGDYVLNILIPANGRAEVHLPGRTDCRVEEGGEDIAVRTDIRIIKHSGCEIVVEVGAGRWHFHVHNAFVVV